MQNKKENIRKKRVTTTSTAVTTTTTKNVIVIIFLSAVTWSVVMQHLVYNRHDRGHYSVLPTLSDDDLDLQQQQQQQQLQLAQVDIVLVNETNHTQTQQQQLQEQQGQQNTFSRQQRHRHPNFRFDFPLCFVHVGKTAGSSISCGLGFQYADCEGMPRQELPHTYYFHMRKNNCRPQRDSIATFLFTVRNPLTRIQSWFEFEKNIVPTRANKRIERQIRKRRGMLFVECYRTFEDFVNVGLQQQQQRQQQPWSSIEAPASATIENMTCPQRAWAAVTGSRDFSYHEYYNYDYYYASILSLQRQKQSQLSSSSTTSIGQENRTQLSSQRFLVLRTEHLADDWSNISTEKLFRQVNRRGTRGNVGNSTATATTTREEGTQQQESSSASINWPNLCYALCEEIQVYKKILYNADNLNGSQIEDSINEVRELCPHEPIEVRPCDVSALPKFPLIKVSRQQYQSEPDSKKKLFEIAG